MEMMHFDTAATPISDRNGLASGEGQKMVFFGSSANLDQVREAYLNLAVNQQKGFLLDYGNVRPSELHDAHELAEILMEEDQSLPVMFCDESHQGTCIPAFLRQHFTVGIIDKNIEKYTDFPGLNLDHTKLIGAQRHAVVIDPRMYPPSQQIPLAVVRTNVQRAEVALRSVDIVVIHLDALRFGDVVGNAGSNTCGLTIEELCHLAKYAGASMNLKAVIVTGYNQSRDVLYMMAKNLSLILYYLVEGFKIRCAEKDDMKNASTYTIIPDELDTELTFVENRQSGRWWLKVENEDGETGLVPCTQKDYDDACKNIISERIMKVFAKI